MRSTSRSQSAVLCSATVNAWLRLNDQIVDATELYRNAATDRWGFFPRRSWPPEQLPLREGDVVAAAYPDAILPATVDGTDARVSLTGQAMATDLSDRITSRLPLFIAAIVAMSFILLMIVFRSVLVPLKAALMNLLSIAAAYGVLVAVAQWGWGRSLFGISAGLGVLVGWLIWG